MNRRRHYLLACSKIRCIALFSFFTCLPLLLSLCLYVCERCWCRKNSFCNVIVNSSSCSCSCYTPPSSPNKHIPLFLLAACSNCFSALASCVVSHAALQSHRMNVVFASYLFDRITMITHLQKFNVVPFFCAQLFRATS